MKQRGSLEETGVVSCTKVHLCKVELFPPGPGVFPGKHPFLPKKILQLPNKNITLEGIFFSPGG